MWKKVEALNLSSNASTESTYSVNQRQLSKQIPKHMELQ